MAKQTYFTITTVLFLIVAAVHLVRAAAGWELLLNGVAIPMWVSWAVVIIIGALAYHGSCLRRKQ